MIDKGVYRTAPATLGLLNSLNCTGVGYQNGIIGSKVTSILLNGCILVELHRKGCAINRTTPSTFKIRTYS